VKAKVPAVSTSAPSQAIASQANHGAEVPVVAIRMLGRRQQEAAGVNVQMEILKEMKI
jgi:hypothetical protein